MRQILRLVFCTRSGQRSNASGTTRELIGSYAEPRSLDEFPNRGRKFPERLIEDDFSTFADCRILEVVFQRHPICFVGSWPASDENDRRISVEPIIQVPRRATKFQRRRSFTFKRSICRLALNLYDAVCHFPRGSADFNVPVNARIKASWVPDETHLEADSFDEVDTQLANQIALCNLFRRCLCKRMCGSHLRWRFCFDCYVVVARRDVNSLLF